jgi:putative MATE family efflux protein
MKTPEEIFQGAYDYFFVICLGIPFTFLYNVASGIIRALGDSRTPFYFLVLSTVLNIVLDFLFILGFGMGVAGAAWATITAQAVAGISCFFYMRKKYEILHSNHQERRLNLGYIGQLIWVAVPMGLQFSITAIGSIMLQSAVNTLDVLYVSAFAAATKVKQLSMCPFEALASACATFGSQNLGAGKISRIKKGLFSGIGIGLIYAVVMGVILATTGSVIAWMFVDKSETAVLAAVQSYLVWQGIFFWLLAILNCTRMTIQGLGYSGIAILAGVSELVARGVVSMVLVPRLGYRGVCMADPSAWLAAVLIVVPVFAVIIRKLGKQLEEK